MTVILNGVKNFSKHKKNQRISVGFSSKCSVLLITIDTYITIKNPTIIID